MSEMVEMVDRVAEALMGSRHPNAPLSFAEVVYAVEKGSDPSVLEGLRRDARAAIEAMREPSDEMVRAAWSNTGSSELARLIWTGCIDAALALPLKEEG